MWGRGQNQTEPWLFEGCPICWVAGGLLPQCAPFSTAGDRCRWSSRYWEGELLSGDRVWRRCHSGAAARSVVASQSSGAFRFGWKRRSDTWRRRCPWCCLLGR